LSVAYWINCARVVTVTVEPPAPPVVPLVPRALTEAKPIGPPPAPPTMNFSQGPMELRLAMRPTPPLSEQTWFRLALARSEAVPSLLSIQVKVSQAPTAVRLARRVEPPALSAQT